MLRYVFEFLLFVTALSAGIWLVSHPRQFNKGRAEYLRRLSLLIGSNPDR